jgi:hypothetical protein
MANEIPVPVLPPQAIQDITRQIARLEYATLAAALIAAAGRPHSVQEVRNLMTDLQYSSNPNPGSGHYQDWQKTSEARLRVPHK